MDILVWIIAVASVAFDWFAKLFASLASPWVLAIIYGSYAIWSISRQIDNRFDRIEKRLDHLSRYRD